MTPPGASDIVTLLPNLSTEIIGNLQNWYHVEAFMYFITPHEIMTCWVMRELRIRNNPVLEYVYNYYEYNNDNYNNCLE